MEILMWMIILGVVVGMIANHKGRSFFPWFIYGAFIFIIAFVHILLIDANNKKKCPFCFSKIPWEASICAYCRKKV
jgi:hypothetical protein